MSNLQKLKIYSFELIKLVVISCAIIIPVRYFLIQPFIVKGASMEDTFFDKEYLIIDEITYRLREPARGDVIVFKFPKDPSQYFIKRVIGLPGESIELRDGYIFISKGEDLTEGKLLNESAYLDAETLSYPNKSFTLGDNEYFVMGDNRSSSMDSRVFGPLPREFIVGRAWLRGWPISRVDVFTPLEYPDGL